MYFNVDIINIKKSNEVDKISRFLNAFDLKYEDVDYTVAISDNENVIGTCSKKGNIIKCFAISEEYQGLGISNTLISKITEKLFEEKIYHNFIFTKPENQYLFESLGYKKIYTTNKVCLLETGNKNINKSLDKLVRDYGIDTNIRCSSIVMNCNPFTLGHRFLIEKASKESDKVIVFIVEEDKSVFPFKARYELVKNGVKELQNVIVVPSGEYIISSATFPNYFLKKDDNILKEYTKLDINIFGSYFKDKFNIEKRYVGSEPSCIVTSNYNDTMKEVLPKYKMEVIEVDRALEVGEVISASRVRKLLKEGKLNEVKKLVPKATMEYLLSEEGEKVISKL